MISVKANSVLSTVYGRCECWGHGSEGNEISHNSAPLGSACGSYENTGLERLSFVMREVLGVSHPAFAEFEHTRRDRDPPPCQEVRRQLERWWLPGLDSVHSHCTR